MKKKAVFLLVLGCLMCFCFAACGRDDNKSNNNSVTDGTYGQNTTTPVPTVAPTTEPEVTTSPDNLGDGIMDGVEDVGDGIINGADEVIDGVGNAIDDMDTGTNGGTNGDTGNR